MSNIEKAVQRLDELRKAGVVVPRGSDAPDTPLVPNAGALPTPERRAATLSPHSASASDAGEPVFASPSVSAPQVGAAPDAARGDAPGSPRVEIDLASMAIAGYVTPEGPRGQIAEEFRVIKRQIIKNAHWKSSTRIERGNRVMVTSALPGEGKTFVAINLALSMALEMDTSVLLIDADIANPCVAKVMNIRRGKGLMDLLTGGGVDINDALLRTNVDKLSMMLAGTPNPRATEMLASQAMADLVAEMASRYPDRILVFDSPPLLVTTEARVLASHMGQIVMVVEAGRTTQTAVTRALETVESCPAVLMVLNKAPRSEVGGYYDYSKYAAAT